MKKILASLAFASIVLYAGAQNTYDAITFGNNHYYGTARSVSLGNAVTALGGDLGMVGINPAGSAVNGYGQLVVTSGLSTSVVNSSYSPAGDGNYDQASLNKYTMLNKPNLAATMCFETGSSRGLKWFTIGLITNHTNNFRYLARTSGHNSASSRFGEFAYSSMGYDSNLLGDRNSFYDTDISWDLLTAYGANLFSSYGSDGAYAGNTEAISADNSFSYVPSSLLQNSKVQRGGLKTDWVINLAGNFNDCLYVGLNLGIPKMDYEYMEYYSEQAEIPSEFPINFIVDGASVPTNFSCGSFDYRYSAKMYGAYAKLGLIWLPTKNIRLGAAYQTPGVYTITEKWQYDASCSFTNSSFNSSCSSPSGNYTYCMRSPSVLDLGVAYVFGTRGLISVDYESMNYSCMRFSDVYYDAAGDMHYDFIDSPYEAQNTTTKLFCGRSRALRVGAELNLNPLFTLRAGYNVVTSPERYAVDSFGNEVTAGNYAPEDYKSGNYLSDFHYYKDLTSSYSFGMGFKSKGSFYADLAVRWTSYPDNYFSPYYDYPACDQHGNVYGSFSPRVHNVCRMADLIATVGFRF